MTPYILDICLSTDPTSVMVGPVNFPLFNSMDSWFISDLIAVVVANALGKRLR